MLCCREPSGCGLELWAAPTCSHVKAPRAEACKYRYLFYRVIKLGKDARLSQFFPKDASEPFLTGQSMWGPKPQPLSTLSRGKCSAIMTLREDVVML